MNQLRLAILLTLAVSSFCFADETFFSTGFEYGTEPVGLLESVELNGAVSQVGSWSGDDFPEADGSGYFAQGIFGGDSAGFVDNPRGGRMLHVDRPLDGAIHFMNLTQPIPTVGSNFSFTAGTIRNGTNGLADYEMLGLDTEGNQSFRIRIGADDNTQRLGYVANGATFFDVPTVSGEDGAADFAAASIPLTSLDALGSVTLTMGEDGYIVDYENLSNGKTYRSNTLPYNGTATELSRVALVYQGDELDLHQQSGFVLDDISVTTGEAPQPFSGYINADDKLVLVGSGKTVLGIKLSSAESLLVPVNLDFGVPPPFDIYLKNQPDDIQAGVLGPKLHLDGELLTPIGYTGPNPETDLTASWGDRTGTRRPFVVTRQGTLPLDCNGDGVVDANDLLCGCAGGSIDDLLEQLDLIAGDLDANGTVDFDDFLALSGAFGNEGNYTDGDIDCNGVVDFDDFLMLSGNFGESSSVAAAAVPEPNTLSLLLLGMCLAILRRKPR